jgi:hypothetical protein
MEDSIKLIDLFSVPESKLTYLSDIATDINYIPLETSKNSNINGIFKIATCNGKIYISQINEVLCFDSLGQFIHINYRGKTKTRENILI